MKHAVIYDNCSNKWDAALPIGNGVLGCMLFYDEKQLHMPINHYEVYYNISKTVLPEDQYKSGKWVPRVTEEGQRARADRNAATGDETYYFYGQGSKDSSGFGEADEWGNTYPATGELTFSFDKKLHKGKSRLALYVDDAKTELLLTHDKDKLEMETIVAREDCIINKVKQSRTGLLKSFSIDFFQYRYIENMPKIEYTQIDDSTFAYTVTLLLENDPDAPFVFSGIISLKGAKGVLKVKDGNASVVLKDAGAEFTVMTGIFTEWKYKNPLQEGLAKMEEFEASLPKLYSDHSAYWKDFFSRAVLNLPDKFLEQVYYVNQYALDCCSGKDGVMKHHACGLNGLWAIRHPNIWGSMWYWDVNIQAAFAGVFSSNRLDLGKVFSDGLLTYVKLAEGFAEKVYGLEGIAADYPYSFYHCCWPWCAQYLWFLYEYSLDEDYLRNDAYPVFIKLAQFLTGLFKYNPDTDLYDVYPDISPEQGPLAHNTISTVASTKYLLKFTLEAAEILHDDNPILDKCREVLAKMPPYPISEDGSYGVHLKDSPEAPDNMWIRHPGMLMPLFPVGEYDIDSDEKTKEILLNTVRFLEERCEIGIFGGSWIAASAARLGKGQTALRLIYERGIDHMLRSNGLTAEETDHFINFCMVCRQPLYYPCMMEFTGEMLAAVNEMLIQSHNGVIRVFPAIPDGDPEMYRMHLHGYSMHSYDYRFAKYDAWKDVRFDRLLAKGAFEVSASMAAGSLEWILLNSRKGGAVKLASPFLKESMKVYCDGSVVPSEIKAGCLCFETEAGKSYLVAESADAYVPRNENEEYNTDIMSHLTYTKRNIYIGENADTPYHKTLDNFMRSWYFGNTRMENYTMYKFDFSAIDDKKYTDDIVAQTNAAEEYIMPTCAYKRINPDNMLYTNARGFGFSHNKGITMADRGQPDVLRRDFFEGSGDVEFIIEAPRGQYELLVISGDEAEASVTRLEAVNGRATGGDVIEKGRYQCKVLPVVQERDEPIRLKISSKKGYKWKVNAIFLNGVKGY